jgi:hypothetical protein
MGCGSQKSGLNHIQSLMIGDHTQNRHVMLRVAEPLDRQVNFHCQYRAPGRGKAPHGRLTL